jgi:tRNA (guanine37-N1)-methyltransferase
MRWMDMSTLQRRPNEAGNDREDTGLGPAGPSLRRVRINVVTMFPGYFEGPLGVSIVARGIEAGILEVALVDLRDHGIGRHRQLDDAPFGGGPGMVMMIEPLAAALDPLEGTHRVLFTPAGAPVTQATFDRWAGLPEITFVCGRFEGVDQRVSDHLIDEEASVGDFVLAGGEVAAALSIEGIARLLPGVVGNPGSVDSESFRDGRLEEPVYTRPADFRGWEVPEVLLTGNHALIEKWRDQQRDDRTRARRPDLLADGVNSET